MSPLELIDSPGGSPVAEKLSASWSESVAAICRLTAVPTFPAWLPGLVTVTLGPLVTIGCETSQPPAPALKSFAQVDCTANEPVVSAMFCAAPWPNEIQAHLSP